MSRSSIALALLALLVLFASVQAGGGGGGGHDDDDDDDDHNNYICNPSQMIALANSYLDSQVSHDWTFFNSHMHPDITLVGNILANPNSVGAADTQAVLGSIGFSFQSIDAIVDPPINTINYDSVTARFAKRQRSLSSNNTKDITFVHTLVFKRGSSWNDCKTFQIRENADMYKTLQVFDVEAGLSAGMMCYIIGLVCKDVPITYDNGGNCYDHWRDAPYMVKNARLESILPEKSLMCALPIVTAITPVTAPFLCPYLGAPVPGVPGCWHSGTRRVVSSSAGWPSNMKLI